MIRTQCLLAAALPLLCSLGLAQDTRTATLVGAVTDASGFAISGAVVVVTNADTAFVSRTQTKDEGSYYVPFLAAGPYELRVEAAGFKKYVRTGIVLHAGETPRVDVQLEIGAVTETLNVTAAAPLLNTENAISGSLFVAKQLNEMTLQQLKPQRVLYYMEGVLPVAGYHIVGQSETQMGYMMDGISGKQTIRTTLSSNETSGFIQPTVDAFEEVKLWSTGTPAELGHSAGGAVSFIFKSGTNQFHGALEDRYQDRFMYHRQYFEQNARQFPYNYHEGQATISGPVCIPKLYDGRNKTFFLFGYGRHDERTDSEPQTTTTPDANMLGGNFSFGGLGYPIYDPTTMRQSSTGSWTADPFPANQIPQTRFDPAVAKFLSMNPYAPATPGGGFYSATGPNSNLVGYTFYRSYRTRIDVKIDHQFTPNHKFFVRYSWNRNRQLGRISIQYLWRAIDSTSFSLGEPEPIDVRNVAFSDYYNFSPTLINEVRFGYNRRNDTITPTTLGQGWAAKLGIPNVGPQNFPGFAGLGSFSVTPGGYSRTLNEDFTFQDNMTKIAGRHTIKWGYEFIRTRENDVTASTPSGTYTFGAAGTALPFTPNTGNAFASFLLGAVTSANFTQLLQNYLPRWWSHAAYLQDDLKLTRNLTINIGIRYSYETPFGTKYGAQSEFSPTTIDPLTGLMGAITHPKGAVYRGDWNNFQPRIGLAWNFRPKWVFRGSFGVLTYDLLPNGGTEEYIAQAVAQQTPGNPLPAFYLSQGPPAFSYKLNSDGTAPFIGSNYSSRNATYIDPALRIPYVMNWSGGFQALLSANWLAEMLYQGSSGVALPGTVNINVLPQSIYNSKNLTLLNQVFAATQNYLPYTQFGAINETSNFGHTTYHGLIGRLQKRLSAGLTYDANFTWSKNLGGTAGSGWQYYDWNLTKGPTSNDTRFRFISNVSYELPFGKGRRFMDVRGWRNHVFGGWNLLWIQTVMSGQPVTFTFAGSPSKYLSGPAYPNEILPYSQVRTPSWSIGPNRFPQSAQNPFFNINAFAYPAPYTPGTLGINTGYAGHLFWPEYSLTKTWSIGERARFTLRVDAHNIPVTPWFNNPNVVVNLTSPQSFGKFSTNVSGTSSSSIGAPNGSFVLGGRLQW
jgi:hypothetical protein